MIMPLYPAERKEGNFAASSAIASLPFPIDLDSGAMIVVIFIFALMSIFYYEYTYYTGEDATDQPAITTGKFDEEDDNDKGRDPW